MFTYKWYLIGIITRPMLSQRSIENFHDNYPKFIVYNQGHETQDIHKCLKEGYAEYRKISFPDCYGCRLVIDVQPLGTVCADEDSNDYDSLYAITHNA